MEQFIQVDMKLLESNELTVTDAVVYSLIRDRMKSSVKRTAFYDHDKKDFYVIYPISEFSDLLGLSKPTIVKSLQRLEDFGYLLKKKLFNAATRLFIVNNDVKQDKNNDNDDSQKPDQNQENLTGKVNKFNSNHNNSSHNDFTKDTDNTDKWITRIENEQLKKSIVEIGGFSKHCANILFDLSYGNTDDVREIVGTIYKAKSNVIKHNKSFKDARKVLLLESDYNKTLDHSMLSILIHANRAKSKLGYIYNAFKYHFENIITRAKLDNQNNSNKTEIPMVKIG